MSVTNLATIILFFVLNFLLSIPGWSTFFNSYCHYLLWPRLTFVISLEKEQATNRLRQKADPLKYLIYVQRTRVRKFNQSKLSAFESIWTVKQVSKCHWTTLKQIWKLALLFSIVRANQVSKQLNWFSHPWAKIQSSI